MVEEVRARIAELKAAPYLVLDLRGNGGGNSLFGHQIAQALLGDGYVDAVAAGEEGEDGCGKAWRVSERNLKQVDYYVKEYGPKLAPKPRPASRRSMKRSPRPRLPADPSLQMSAAPPPPSRRRRSGG